MRLDVLIPTIVCFGFIAWGCIVDVRGREAGDQVLLAFVFGLIAVFKAGKP